MKTVCSPSAGDTRPSAVRTKCVILFFRAFLFWLPTGVSKTFWVSGEGDTHGLGAFTTGLDSVTAGSGVTTSTQHKHMVLHTDGFKPVLAWTRFIHDWWHVYVRCKVTCTILLPNNRLDIYITEPFSDNQRAEWPRYASAACTAAGSTENTGLNHGQTTTANTVSNTHLSLI